MYFPHDLMRSACLLADFEDARIGVGKEIAGFGIDQKKFLFHPERDRKVFPVLSSRHGPHQVPGRNEPQRTVVADAPSAAAGMTADMCEGVNMGS